MRTRTLLAAATVIAAFTLATPSASASAAPATAAAVLTTDSAGTAPVAAGDVLTAALAANTSATFYSTSNGSTGVTCAVSQFTATAVGNPAAPGSATESLTGQTFDSCTSNVTGVTSVDSLTVDNLAYDIAVSDAPGNPVTITAGTAGPVQATANLETWFGPITCSFQLSGAFTGTADNTTNGLTFTNEHFTLSSGSGLCPSDGYFSAAYGPVADTTAAGSPSVYVN